MAQRIPEELIEEIRSQADIVDVISNYMQLTKRGRNYFGLCPFHGESTPSFSVSIDKQIFHCFGCGAGGNAITFLMDIENLPFQDAVSKLGEQVGVQVDIAPSQGQRLTTPASPEEERMKEAHILAADYFQQLLLNTEEGEEGLRYLENRGFTRDMIETYGIGWSMPNWDSLTTLLQHKGFDLDEMEQGGLIIKREDGSGYFDRFRSRIMFPIRDDIGRIIAFSGRVINTEGEAAKYMNSPESPIFQKSKVLYNLDQARPVVRKERKLIIFEGFMDVLASKNANIHHGVATMGTSLTPQHIQKLKRITSQIIVCYDGDHAGWEAAKRAAEMLHAENLTVEVAVLPAGLDPDEYIRKNGAESFRDNIIAVPQSFISFMMMYAKRNKNFQYPNDVQQYADEALSYLTSGISPIERELYIKRLSEETQVSTETLQGQLRLKEAQQASTQKQQERNMTEPPSQQPQQLLQKRKYTAIDRAERLLLAHMLHDMEAIDKIRDITADAPFVREDYLAIYAHLMGFYETFEKEDYQRFVEILEDRELRKIVMEAAIVDRDPDHTDEEIADCLKQVQKFIIQQQIADKQHAVKEAEQLHDIKSAIALSQEVIDLKKSLTRL
ncbi:DNA primase [Kurthia sibirica]|uniref:DNA primase n=1 Tax=Kurthia sibirica TaxID=202750 RepID=A0A2U3AM32_9BACL|nr:DNA primase [Kurthia sibirica]PWI25580.1 DNA primase [Kurthia sibirica]GEK35363.1 DNA primase [Kurthia sibirica]